MERRLHAPGTVLATAVSFFSPSDAAGAYLTELSIKVFKSVTE